MAYIGDIYVQYVDKVERSGKKDVKTLRLIGLDDPNLIEEKLDADDIKIGGVAVDDATKTADRYIEDLKATVRRGAAYNHFNYAGIDGFVAVSNISTTKSAEEDGIVKWDINGRFLTKNVYERAYKFTQEIEVNDFGMGFPAVIPLPVGATNVKLKSPWQTISLNSPWATITGKDGDIPLYKPFPLFNAEKAITTGSLSYLEEAYRLQTVNLDVQAKYAEWSFNAGEDVPYGTYKLKIRVRDDNIANDITVTVMGSKSGTILSETLSTGGTEFIVLETSEFLLDDFERITVKIEKATATANTIEIDYAYLEPTYTAKILFDVDSEDSGVKVYDDMNDVNEANWLRVYNLEHNFTGNAVVENGVIRVVISSSDVTLYGWSVTTANWVEIGKIKLSRDFKEVLNDYVRMLDDNEITRIFLSLDYDWIYDGLVLYLPFVDGTAKDYSGYGNDGTIYGATSVKGRYGYAMSFNGQSQYVDVPHSPELHNDSFTLAGWVYIRNNPTSHSVWLFGKEGSYFLEYYSNKVIALWATDATGTTRLLGNYGMDLQGKWTFIAVTFDNTTGIARIYINGQLVSSNTVGSVGIYNAGNPFKIGYPRDINTEFWACPDGIIDEVRIYARALTDEEIQALYTITKLWRIPSERLGYEINDGFVATTGFKKYGQPSFIGAIPLAQTSNLFSEAEDGNLSAGAYINRYIDYFSADSSSEYTVLIGNAWIWDTVNGVLRAQASTTAAHLLILNSLEFGSGTYSVDLKINSSVAAVRDAGLVFCYKNDSFYLVYLRINTNNNSRLDLTKYVNGSWNLIASTNVTATIGVSYNLKVVFDSTTGQINVYFNNSPTPTISAVDREFSSGKVGLRAWTDTNSLDVEFDNLDIQAEEVTSSNNTCVIMGGANHGGRTGINESCYYNFVAGTDVPLGRYLAVARVKSTSPSTLSSIFSVYKYVDTAYPIDLDGFGTFPPWTIPSKDYSYIIRPIELGKDDEGKICSVRVYESGDDSNPVVIIDYFVLIPISLLESQQLGLQDLAFLSMVDTNLKRVLEVKDA